MKQTLIGLTAVAAVAAAVTLVLGLRGSESGGDAEAAGETTPLKEAKLNIEHNATDGDTGLQGFIDSEGWDRIEASGPGGAILSFRGKGELGTLGLTELFFETVEPKNADVPVEELLATLPEGEYTFTGKSIENGERSGKLLGTAWLTHDIPEGPALVSPSEEAIVPPGPLTMDWEPVTQTIDGGDVKIVAYQLIVEKDEEPDPNMIGTFGLSMYLPPVTTSITLADGFLEPGTAYKWEVLAIEESGNQTLSSGAFETE
jgi:hypothetical protein